MVVKIEIDDLIVDLNCTKFGYTDTITGEKGEEVPNPQSKEDFIVELFNRQLFSDAASQAGETAAALARQQAIDAIVNLGVKKSEETVK